jgi:peptide/nickel transport system substrate-binding protein
MDERTLRIPTKMPYAAFPDCIAANMFFGIVPSDYDAKRPVGTGPFKVKTFVPGQQSIFERFDDYWGQPAYFDTVTIIDSFSDETAAFNALQGGEVDVLASATPVLAKQISDNTSLKSLISKPSVWTPFTMRIDQPPFDDADVRMAFRLLVDRDQIINIAFGGYGEVAHDLFSPADPCFDASLLRHRDIDKAKFLLKKAGKENLTVELVTSDINPGVVQSAQIFAQQAKAAGVTVNIKQVTTDVFFGSDYLKWNFAQDWWNYFTYMCTVNFAMLPDSAYNETHWTNPRYNKLYGEAQKSLDLKHRCEIIHEMQHMEFDFGGYIIPSFNCIIDLMRKDVNGFRPGRNSIPLGNWAFHEAWLA